MLLTQEQACFKSGLGHPLFLTDGIDCSPQLLQPKAGVVPRNRLWPYLAVGYDIPLLLANDCRKHENVINEPKAVHGG
jgi:hypothetical protein